MRRMKLVDIEELKRRMFTDEKPWDDMDTEEILDSMPVMTLNITERVLKRINEQK